MGKNDATKEQMEEALRKVNLLEFMNEQDGINTKLLEQGSNLSGGQKQRLNLARAILHDTPVYIFDEATSNIDAESENEIMAVINKLAETKTVILISHRLQNVVKSDCIYAMKDGKVAEAGTHNELINNNGEYASLYNRQKQLEQYGKGGAVNGPCASSSTCNGCSYNYGSYRFSYSYIYHSSWWSRIIKYFRICNSTFIKASNYWYSYMCST